jgi:prophage regulatory protein
MAQQTILRLPQALARTGISRSTAYAFIKAGTFPKPIALGTRAIGFLSGEIDAWIEGRVKASREAA